VLPYVGYGADGWVRVLARVLLAPPSTSRRDLEAGRGWRRFMAASARGVDVTIDLGGQPQVVRSRRGGYIDVVLPANLPAGWNEVRVSAGSAVSKAPVHVIAPGTSAGLVSDIDDTVMVTALPRPLVALWNTFVRSETSRRPVPGVADLYRAVLAERPDTFVVYLSTGPWNVAPALQNFLDRHQFPRGPLLMTDWGPTETGWFRSGREHKRAELGRLVRDLPAMRWLLVGDDGQHDPQLYAEAAACAPDKIEAIAIRQLTRQEQVLTHGTAEPLDDPGDVPPPTVPTVRAPDGYGLLAALRERKIMRG
jgi:phosphatidate phosphatase APP1